MPVLVNPSLFGAGAPPPTSYSAAVLAEATLLAYYRLGESSGTTMADSSPGAHDGTYFATKTGAAGLLTGDTDGATTQAGHVTAASWMNVSGITVECIIKPNGAQSNTGIATRFDSPHVFLIWMDVSGHIAWRPYNTVGSSVDLSWSTAPTTGTKYHVAATYVAGQARLYVNGTQVASSTALTGNLATDVTQAFEVGAYQNDTFKYDGTVDEVALYSGEQSAASIAARAALV